MTNVLIFLLVACAIVALFFLGLKFFRKKTFNSLSLKILNIRLPQEELENKDFTEAINKSEQLLSSLSGLSQPFVLEMAVHNVGAEINFYLAVPRSSLDFVKQEVRGFFPDAQIEEDVDYTIFHPDGGSAGASLSFNESRFVPIRTYKESGVDTFAAVASTMSKLRESGDGAALQIVLRPASESVRKEASSLIDSLKKGKTLKEISGEVSLPGKEIASLLFGGNSSSSAEEKEAKLIDEESIKSVQQKISKPLFMANVRIVTSSNTKDRASDILLSVAGSFSQYGAPLRNSFKVIKPRRLKKLFSDYIFREFDLNSSILLNTEELASVFHLPTASTDVPRIGWVKSKEVEPPKNLPAEGVIVGTNTFRGEESTIRMTDNDRRRHFYIVGQTGTGKSYLMLDQAVQDMQAGKGLAVVDPHGDLVDKILERVPADRIEDVIIFNPGDLTRPLGLNMLEFDQSRPEEKTFIVNEIQSIFNQLFDRETMGPMFEQYMRNALLLLMEDMTENPSTLIEVPRIFTDHEFRRSKLAKAKNPTVIDFWTKEAIKATGEQGLANITPYITSKFGNFISNDYMRPIIGQTKSAFDFRQVMDEGKILLVNLSKGRIGDINAGLLGMIVTGRILLAALSRTDIAEDNRRDFYLYIDEFQNFTTDSISVILSEARKYKLNLILAHQFIDQLTPEIKDSIFGNVGSMASFRVGASDAEFLVKYFGPTFTERDLVTIENQNALGKFLIAGEPAKPFNFKTRIVEKGSIEVRDKLKELSRLTYGQDLAEVEQNIITRLRSSNQ